MSERLVVHRFGQSGPVMVLLHGLGASGRYWRLVAERLTPGVRLVCPDTLGFGRSPRPRVAYTVADHLAALDATLDGLTLGSTPVVLAGHSTGALLALAWAAARPDRFAAVGALSLPAYRSTAEARACIARLSPLAWATVRHPGLGELVCGVMCAGRPLWQALMPLLMPNTPPDIARELVLHDWVSYGGTLTNVVVTHRVRSAVAAVARSGLPVHLLHGDHDRTVPVAVVQDLAHQCGVPLHVLSGQGHTLPVTASRACADFLRALIRQSSG